MGPVLGLKDQAGSFLELGGGKAVHAGEGVVAQGGLGVALAVKLEHQLIPHLTGDLDLPLVIHPGLDPHLLQRRVDLPALFVAHSRKDDLVSALEDIDEDCDEKDKQEKRPRAGDNKLFCLIRQLAPKFFYFFEDLFEIKLHSLVTVSLS